MNRDHDTTDIDAPGTWRLEILEGPNAGATLALPPGPYRLGLGAANDIVLSDPSIAAEQASLIIAASGAILTSHAPGVDVQRRALTEGRPCRLGRQNEIRLGNTVMRVRGPHSGTTIAGAVMPGRSAWAGLAMAGLAVAGLTFAVGRPAPRGPAAASAAVAPQTLPEGAQSALAARLRLSGLSGALTVSGGAGGALLVSGILPANAAPAWHAVRTWFDTKYGTSVTLLERFGTPAQGSPPPLDIAAVALSPVPLVVTRDGARYTQGAALPGGWTLDTITGSAVTLSQNGHTLRITL